MKGRMVGALVIVSVALATGLPARDALVQELAGDTAVVESTIREVRAAMVAAPSEKKESKDEGEKKMFVRTFGAAEDQKNKVHGYRQRVNDDGDDGYKHFDSFHKKNGDKYGYETFSSYGIHEHGAKEGGDAHSGAESKNEESSHHYHDDDDDEGDAKESKNTYKVVEDGEEGDDGESGHYSSYSSGESDGDGDEGTSGSSSAGSYSKGGESASFYAGGGEYNNEGDGDNAEYSEGYSEGGSTSSSYSTSEGDGDGESHDEY